MITVRVAITVMVTSHHKSVQMAIDVVASDAAGNTATTALKPCPVLDTIDLDRCSFAI
jgi:hypothetical protein